MEASTHFPPPDLEAHIQGLLHSLQAAEQSISTKTNTTQPSKATNTYYAPASSSSPNLSHLPLPPNLLHPLTLRLIPGGTKPAKSTLTTPAMAFELSTPTALNQSIHFYFPTHISANLAMGLYPTFSEATLLVAVPNVVKGGNGKDEKVTSMPIHGALSPTGTGGDVYVERIVKEAASGRLRGVVVYVEWRAESQEFAQEMAPRPMRRAARRTAGGGGAGFGRRVEAQFEIEDGDGDDEDDEDFAGVIWGRGGQNRTMTRAMQLDQAMDDLREAAVGRAVRPTFQHFLEALERPVPPGGFLYGEEERWAGGF